MTADNDTTASRLAPMVGVLRTRHVPRLLSASLLGRLPTGMAALAILLIVRAHGGGYTLAGALSAIYAASAAVGGPLLGRAIDRTRQPPVLVGSGLVASAGFLALAVIDPVANPTVAIVAATVAGGATPQLEPCLRVLWSPVLRDEQAVHSAYSLDAATQELIFVTGPVIVLGVTTLAGPGAGLVAAAILGLTGSVWFATAAPARRWRGTASTQRHWVGPLKSPGLIRLLAGLVFVGATIGTFTVGITAYAEEVAVRTAAGWLIAANAGGALIGGIAYTMTAQAPDPHRRLRALLGVLALGYLPLLAQPGLVGTAPLAFLSGCALPPVLTCSFTLVGQLAPQGTITEAHSWMITAFGVGNAAGSALAGVAADLVSSRLALGSCVVAASLALWVVARPLVTRHAGPASLGHAADPTSSHRDDTC